MTSYGIEYRKRPLIYSNDHIPIIKRNQIVTNGLSIAMIDEHSYYPLCPEQDIFILRISTFIDHDRLQIC